MLGMTVARLEREMTTEEFLGWMRFVDVEPFNIQEIQMATLNYITSIQKGSKVDFEDFMVSKAPESKEEKLSGKALEQFLLGVM